MPGLGRRHPARMTLDVVMEDFWTRPAGVYSKPVWLRPDVLQLVFDDDNSPSKTYSGPTVPGGHTAFTRTATVYSTTLIGAGDLTVESDDPITEVLRNQVAAFTQRVGNCYLVEANILGFAGVLSGLKEEQAVLSNALKWALADYGVRFGKQPEQIVLHLDVNGTLALGDVAGNKNFGKMVNSLAAEVLKRVEEKVVSVPDALRDVILRANEEKEEGVLRQQFTANYSSQDFIRCVVMALGALAPAAIQDLDDQLSGTAGAAGDFNEKFRSATTAKAFDEARAAESLEAPALTLAIRTNGVEHRQGSVYVQRLVHGVLGVELSDERDTVRRYLVTHEDRARGSSSTRCCSKSCTSLAAPTRLKTTPRSFRSFMVRRPEARRRGRQSRRGPLRSRTRSTRSTSGFARARTTSRRGTRPIRQSSTSPSSRRHG